MADPSYIDADGVLTDGEAWVALASTTLGSDTASITFTSTDDGQVGDWSQYMDLVIVHYGRSVYASTVADYKMRYNDDSGANYVRQDLAGYGTGTEANSYTGRDSSEIGYMVGASIAANIFSSGISHIFDINSGKYKSDLNLYASDTDGAGYIQMIANTWKSQAPITEIKLFGAGNLLAATRADLFGVLPRMAP